VKSAATQLAIAYGRTLLTEISGQDCGATHTPVDWKPWTDRLFESEVLIAGPVYSIWTQVTMPKTTPAGLAYVPMAPITLAARNIGGRTEWMLNPLRDEASYQTGVEMLLRGFLENGGKAEQDFDRFYTLMQMYTSALPCTYGEDGVSLFQQWRMVSAVMTISEDGTPEGLPESLGLIGFDLPGIQETVYTIASRGAGKSVRGRSAFVQLLVNALVDALVSEMDLCRANVLINAGGNALILCGWSADLDQQIVTFSTRVNRLLFSGIDGSPFVGFSGDLSLAVACEKAPWEILAYPVRQRMDEGAPVSEWQYYEKRLKQGLNAAKQKPFIMLLKTPEKVERFFTPDPISTNRYCAVCRKPEDNAFQTFDPLKIEEDQEDSATQAVICPMCDSFKELADDLGKRGRYLNCQRVAVAPANTSVWQRALHAASNGLVYSFTTTPMAQGRNLALTPDDFSGTGVHGLWPMAHTTPMSGGAIRDNQSLADESPSSFRRLGVLKADVDDLGAMLVHGLRDRRSAALTATMSESLSLFFGCWLDRICAEAPYKDLVYVLYAGGDDLLIVGAWHVIPMLAERLASDFERYTGNNQAVHLSAGVTMVGGKEPLYAAIDGASAALKQAKSHRKGERQAKQAISMFDEVFDWARFRHVMGWQETLQSMTASGAPSAVLVSLLQLYAQYQDDQRSLENSNSGYATRGRNGRYNATDEEIMLGPWLWQMIYRFHRLANQNKEVQGSIENIQKEMLKPDGVRQLAVAARWAQLLSREKTEETKETDNGQSY